MQPSLLKYAYFLYSFPQVLVHSLRIVLSLLVWWVEILFEIFLCLIDRLQLLLIPLPFRFLTTGRVRHLAFLAELQLRTRIIGIATINDIFFHGVNVYLLDVLGLGDRCKI